MFLPSTAHFCVDFLLGKGQVQLGAICPSKMLCSSSFVFLSSSFLFSSSFIVSWSNIFQTLVVKARALRFGHITFSECSGRLLYNERGDLSVNLHFDFSFSLRLSHSRISRWCCQTASTASSDVMTVINPSLSFQRFWSQVYFRTFLGGEIW